MKSFTVSKLMLVVAFAAVALPGSVFADSSVAGSVSFTGEAPAAKPVKMNADPACKSAHSGPVMDNSVVVNSNNTLKNVFVYVKEGVTGEYPAPAEVVKLDQKGCWYEPHVFGIQVGQQLEISNSDATLHNVNAKAKANRPFNIAQPVQNMKSKKKFSKPEVMVSVKCNVHPWMQSYAGVVEHPFFAVTDATGAFSIEGLPAGDYVLEAWHEELGTQTQNITVAEGAAATADFSFSAQ